MLNCNEYSYYFYHINLGHIKLGYYGTVGKVRLNLGWY